MKQNKMKRCAGGSRDDTACTGDTREGGGTEGGNMKEEDGGAVNKEEEVCGGENQTESRCRCVGSRAGTVCQAER